MATSRALLLKEAAPQLHTSNIDVLAQGQSFLGGALSFLNHSLSVAAAAGSAQAVLASLTKVFLGAPLLTQTTAIEGSLRQSNVARLVAVAAQGLAGTDITAALAAMV